MRDKLLMPKTLLASMVGTAVLALASVTASGAQPQIPTPSISQASRADIKAAKEAIDGKRYSEAAAKANAVLASSGKTKDDAFAAYSFLFTAAQAQGDKAGMMKALEGQIETGFLPPAAQTLQYRNLLGMAYQNKDFRKAIEYGQLLIKGGDTSPEVSQWVGQGYYELKEYPAAVKFFEGVVGDKEKRGAKPGRNELIQLRSAYDKVGNKDAAQSTLEKVVKYYPDAGTWSALLYDVKKERLDPRQKLHLYRLMELTGNLKQPQDFLAYSEAATAQGLLAESKKVLEAGMKINAFPAGTEQDRAKRYIASATKSIDASKGELPKLEGEAKAAPNGEKYVMLGNTHYSFDQYANAVSALQAGLTKGGLKNDADARVTLGVAQLKAGQKGEALKTFRATKTDDEVTRRLVQLWALYAS
jgi:TolA-binding protein